MACRKQRRVALSALGAERKRASQAGARTPQRAELPARTARAELLTRAHRGGGGARPPVAASLPPAPARPPLAGQLPASALRHRSPLPPPTHPRARASPLPSGRLAHLRPRVGQYLLVLLGERLLGSGGRPLLLLLLGLRLHMHSTCMHRRGTCMAHATCIAHAWHAHGRCMVDVRGTSLLDSARGRGQGGVRAAEGEGCRAGHRARCGLLPLPAPHPPPLPHPPPHPAAPSSTPG